MYVNAGVLSYTGNMFINNSPEFNVYVTALPVLECVINGNRGFNANAGVLPMFEYVHKRQS